MLNRDLHLRSLTRQEAAHLADALRDSIKLTDTERRTLAADKTADHSAEIEALGRRIAARNDLIVRVQSGEMCLVNDYIR